MSKSSELPQLLGLVRTSGLENECRLADSHILAPDVWQSSYASPPFFFFDLLQG